MSGLAHTNGRSSKQALVRDQILTRLDELTVGDALPSERRLSSDLSVSRPTLRAVIDELVREGLLLRRHGSGTCGAGPACGEGPPPPPPSPSRRARSR